MDMDDDDAFLYGDQNGQSNDSPAQPTVSDDATTANNEPQQPIEPQTEGAPTPELEDSEEDEYEDDSDSDDDVEFIIGDIESKSQAPEKKLDTDSTSEQTQQTVPILTESAGLDINTVAQYEEIPLTQLTLSELKDKPWRLPGADLSDYFNYGFDEISWLAYCAKQDKLHSEFNPAKVMTELLNSGCQLPPTLQSMMPPGAGAAPGAGANGLPPFMMPPIGMPFMPGMPNMPNMPSIPNMSNMPNMPNMPNIPNMPNMSNMPNMPNMNMFNNNNNSNNNNSNNNNGNSNNTNSNNATPSMVPAGLNLPARLPSRPPSQSMTPEPVGSRNGAFNARDQADKEAENKALGGGNNRGSAGNYRTDRNNRRRPVRQ
ncbi:unnamed protein product [Ambrosiozyma monospora]|uniref:Unnamed protein product n=1 Tax=Ambrosiozyma monospora TaxID=43982 RepID=A0ACB5STK4_AMBMO|nr:unnamed protein product [Ambrosiozyma monospora]